MEWHNWLGSLGQHVYDDYTDIINTWHDDKQGRMEINWSKC
jgi:hypothetical protein